MASGWLLVYFFGSVLMDEFLEKLLWSFLHLARLKSQEREGKRGKEREREGKRGKERIVVIPSELIRRSLR
jgi:GTPase involved in cell partitioning and DNA repair